MGKHNKPRRSVRSGQIIVAAAAASVLAGWAAPVAYADDDATNDKPSNPISKTADAVKSTVDGVRKAVTGAAGSFQRRRRTAIQIGSGGAGTSMSLIPKSPKTTVSARTITGGPSNALAVPALVTPSQATPTPDASDDIRHGLRDHPDCERHPAESSRTAGLPGAGAWCRGAAELRRAGAYQQPRFGAGRSGAGRAVH